MLNKKDSVADLVASDMADIMASEEHRTVFAKPSPPTKEAGKKKGYAHGEKDHQCAKDCPSYEMPKKKKASVADQFGLSVQALAKVSEVLDELGFEKQALMALKTLEALVSEADIHMAKDDKKDDDKEDEKKEDKDEENKNKDPNKSEQKKRI